MVTTRRQASSPKSQISAKPRQEQRRRTQPQEHPRPPKTIVQRRRQASATTTKSREDVAPPLRDAVSTAPELGNHVLFLFVGDPAQLLTVHSELLPEATRLYIASKNQGRQVYQLPDENFEIAQIYRLFLYTGLIYSMHQSDQDRPDNGRREAHADAEWMRLAHCYLFGVTIGDENFANACITAITQKMMEKDRYPTGLAFEVYAYTSPGDALRRLIVDVHVFRGLGQWVFPPHDDANGPKEFMQDIVSGLAAEGGKQGFWGDDLEMPWEGARRKCAYHKHVATARCG